MGRPRPDLPRCAGLPRRAVATLLDVGIYLVVAAATAWPLAHRLAAVGAAGPGELLVTAAWTPGLRRLAAATLAGWVLLWWIYLVLGWGVLGATPGKAALGLAVVDWRGRHPIGPARAMLRLAAYALSSACLGLGHLLVAARSDHRALHDLLAGTRVVRRRDLRAARATAGEPA